MARGNVRRFRAAPSQQELGDACDQAEAMERADHRARETGAGRDPNAVPAGCYIERLPILHSTSSE